ncbi:MAG: hypothetical protein B6U73_05080 [Desulfurococcales archaeon ex4484_204]|nr:MAG: hypothetical protein B6U73_05080 [Desulfurococcales archaeon ex4484_204]
MAVKVLKNQDVKRVVAFIPRGHRHVRLAIETSWGDVIILQQAVVDAVLRAYAQVAAHPVRRGVELRLARIGKELRKEGFAEWQLVESSRPEDDVVEELTRTYLDALLKGGGH